MTCHNTNSLNYGWYFKTHARQMHRYIAIINLRIRIALNYISVLTIKNYAYLILWVDYIIQVANICN